MEEGRGCSVQSTEYRVHGIGREEKIKKVLKKDNQIILFYKTKIKRIIKKDNQKVLKKDNQKTLFYKTKNQ